MSKQIHLTYGGKEYVLEFTRKTVERMEKSGFNIGDMLEKPVTNLPTLFAGAFYANHPFVNRNVINEIYGKITNRAELISKLSDMYNEPIMEMLNDPPESEENVEWTASE